ncbi:MAG: aldehyde ferredoxin oxidoreductase family protein [Deltaproteobacteria bacterium]|nr:aldehyde ferredoxin oxidoreductase family protein [Deltaproteobacteria bacterium]
MNGYFLKLLKIDATKKNFHVEDIDKDVMETSIGGKGLATRLLLDCNPAGVDALGPDNHLIITAGPFCGSSLYGSSRYGVFSKSPLTGFYGESYSGGSFAGPLGNTGFDAVLIKGAAENPVWIEISPDNVIFHDAKRIWGRDTFEAEDYLKKESPGKSPGIMVIGPAGENLVRFAVIKNDRYRVAGRTGMGAVLGSKKIKGIVCHGDKKRIFHDPDGIKKYKKKMLARLKDDKVVHAYRTMGTPMMVDILNNAGAFPTEYWKRGRFEKKDSINAAAMAKRLKPVPHACRDCFLGCGKYTEVQQGRHKGLKLEGPEYETIYAFGGLCMIDEIEEIAYLNRLCDSLGVDTISSGNLAAFAIEASKSGRINEKLEYGSADDVANLIRKIVKRQGVGGILAEGIKPAAEELDMQDIIVHVKGMEPAGYDPRILKGMGLAYAVSERGACHLRTTFYKAELAGMVAPEAIDNKVELFTDFEDRCTLFDCFILCRFFRDLYPWEELSRLLFLTTGLSYDQTRLSSLAAGIKDNTRHFNLREGLTSADDTLPARLFDQKLEGDKGITQNELRRLVSEYYKIRGWDAGGIPPAK